MADVLNRATKQHLTSVNTPEYPVAEWIINPDLSAVTGQPVKYWVISGDSVSLMDQAERDAVDAALREASRDATVAQLDQLENVLRALMLIILDQVNALRAQHGLTEVTPSQLRTAIRNKLGS